MNGKEIEEKLERLKGVNKEQYQKIEQELRDYVEANLEEVCNQAQRHEMKANRYSFYETALLISILIITAFTPLINYFDFPKFVPLLSGTIDIILIGLMKLFNFRERAINLYQTRQRLLLEHNQYRTSRGDYGNVSIGVGLDIFLDRIEKINVEAFQNTLTLAKSTNPIQAIQQIKTE